MLCDMAKAEAHGDGLPQAQRLRADDAVSSVPRELNGVPARRAEHRRQLRTEPGESRRNLEHLPTGIALVQTSRSTRSLRAEAAPCFGTSGGA